MSLVSSVNADTDIKYGKYICRELINVYFDKGKIKKQTPDEDFHVFEIMEKVIVEHRKNINDKVEYYEYERLGQKYTHLDHGKIRGVKVDYALRTIVFKHPFLS